MELLVCGAVGCSGDADFLLTRGFFLFTVIHSPSSDFCEPLTRSDCLVLVVALVAFDALPSDFLSVEVLTLLAVGDLLAVSFFAEPEVAFLGDDADLELLLGLDALPGEDCLLNAVVDLLAFGLAAEVDLISRI